MKTKTKGILLALLVVSLLTSIAGCGTAPVPKASESLKNAEQNATGEKTTKEMPKKEPVTISLGICASWIEMGGMKDIIKGYEIKSGNKVEIQSVEDKQFDQLVMAKLATGDVWDMFARYVGTSSVKYNPKASCVDLSGEPWVPRLVDGILPELKQDDGKIYSSPFGGGYPIGMVYNKKVFQDNGITVPKTYSELEKVCEILKTKNITPIFMAAKDSWPLVQAVSSVWPQFMAADPYILDKLNTNKVKWSEIPGFMTFLKKTDEYVKKGYYNQDMASATYAMQIQALAEGTAAMAYQGSWIYDEIVKVKADARVGMFPAVVESGDPQIPTGYQGGIYIFNQSPNIDTCKDFLNFVNRVENLNAFYGKKPDIPAWKDITVEKLNPFSEEILPLVKEGKSKPHWNDVYIIPYSEDFNSVLIGLFLGRKTPEETAKSWDDMMIKFGKANNFAGF